MSASDELADDDSLLRRIHPRSVVKTAIGERAQSACFELRTRAGEIGLSCFAASRISPQAVLAMLPSDLLVAGEWRICAIPVALIRQLRLELVCVDVPDAPRGTHFEIRPTTDCGLTPRIRKIIADGSRLLMREDTEPPHSECKELH